MRSDCVDEIVEVGEVDTSDKKRIYPDLVQPSCSPSNPGAMPVSKVKDEPYSLCSS